MTKWVKSFLVWNTIPLALFVVAGRGMFGFDVGPVLYLALTCLSVALCSLGISNRKLLLLSFWLNLLLLGLRPVLGFLATFTFAPGDDGGGLRWLVLAVVVGLGDWAIGATALLWALVISKKHLGSDRARAGKGDIQY